MKIFITGGSGFLGGHSIEELVKDGHEVYALARSKKSLEKVKSLGAIPVKGNILYPENFESSLKNIDVVIHCAAPVEFWGPWEFFDQHIVQSSFKLAKLADRYSVKRFIHISSESVLFDEDHLIGADEDTPYPPHKKSSYYGKAKMLAEKKLISAKLGLDLIILRPTFIWGNGCPSFDKIEHKLKRFLFLWVDQGKTAFEAVHVLNVVEAIKCALVKGERNGVYFVTDNEKVTVRQFFSAVFKALKWKSPPFVSIPGRLAHNLACFFEFFWRLLKIKKQPPITYFDIHFVNLPRQFNIQKAQKELGYGPIISQRQGIFSLGGQVQ